MATEYIIYLVNNSTTTKRFWCFLAPPEELAGDPAVFANSSTWLSVDPDAEGENTFTVPAQFSVGAGASNNAVGLNIKINSNITKNADLQQLWEANYSPPRKGPTLRLAGASPANTIAIQSNDFDQRENEDAGWYSNMSFGIQTDQGFVGMTWSPSPQETRTLTPKLAFYIATGTYGENSLANWSDVSNKSAMVTVPKDFKERQVTVTLTSNGGWAVTPGKPAPRALSGRSLSGMAIASSLVQSHNLLSVAHADLVELVRGRRDAHAVGQSLPRLLEAGLSADKDQRDKVTKVDWSKKFSRDPLDATNTYLTGTLTVATALVAGFAVFMLAGIEFSVLSGGAGATSISFSYSGSQSAEHIKSLLVAGAEIVFGKPA
jgi:hypothetical protein